ncbi:hypothetical protein [Humidesulfovibrio idahonensis]
MNKFAVSCCIVAAIVFAGCARLDFGEDRGLTYYEAKPFLFVSTNKDCVSSATVLMLPAEKRQVRFVSGYGTSDLSVALSNGMITNVGQKTDAKIPETMTSLAGLATASVGVLALTKGVKAEAGCPVQAHLYPVEGGLPNLQKPIVIPLNQ